MAGGIVRQAARQVSVTKEIVMGSVLALAGGFAWRSWHLSYKAGVDEFYAKLEAEKKSKS